MRRSDADLGGTDEAHVVDVGVVPTSAAPTSAPIPVTTLNTPAGESGLNREPREVRPRCAAFRRRA